MMWIIVAAIAFALLCAVGLVGLLAWLDMRRFD
jgi:ABC-type phosphate transport system auxiliary subunit